MHYSYGFHGDEYLISFINDLLKDRNYFLETGTFEADTLFRVGNDFPNIKCFSCEPNIKRYNTSVERTKNQFNTICYNLDSIEFMNEISKINIWDEKILIWLDAHGDGFQWPLKEEVKFFTLNFNNIDILIDDFQVPQEPQFDFDTYNGQHCSYEFIKNSIANKNNFNLFYPSYNIITSTGGSHGKGHRLRGWCLLTNNKTDLTSNIIKQVPIAAI